ncbi:30S ribosomal protein S20 [Bacillus fonticola]|uniref:30S ribosomal protein S20 n=1 Tax=Bacillus fonticola TaxID=2728853 RepID=UPI00147345E7|nr:30S ribosomal protein S20 [Bacillus fonticola]
MPNIKSAIKRVKTNDTRYARNAAQKSAMRTAVKKVEAAVANSNAQAAQDSLKVAAKHLDKAVNKGILHKNAANRHKSRLTKQVNGLQA